MFFFSSLCSSSWYKQNKVGSFKLVVAEDADSVKEVLVKKSADYAGRTPFYSFQLVSLGTVCLYTLHCI